MEQNNFSVSIPAAKLPDAEWERMKALFGREIELERHAFGAESLGLRRCDDGRVEMFGLPLNDGPYVRAACQYMELLAKLAHEMKRVNQVKLRLPENEKYAFRVWLLRLGFIGPEYKESRELLLKNLPGSASRKEYKS